MVDSEICWMADYQQTAEKGESPLWFGGSSGHTQPQIPAECLDHLPVQLF